MRISRTKPVAGSLSFVDGFPCRTWVLGPDNAAGNGRDSRSLNFDSSRFSVLAVAVESLAR